MSKPTPPVATILNYGAPKIAFGTMNALFIAYLMKFATDVLLIAPAVMGTLLAASRIWDAVTDPLVGYLSDRTQSRWGRRRVWLFAAALPCAVGLVMIWSPPTGLDGTMLIVWMAAGLFLWEAATTAFYVPYGALGLALAPTYHERSRLFGYLQMITAIGMMLGMGTLQLMNAAADKRAFAADVSLIAGVLIASVILVATWRMREPSVDARNRDLTLRSAFRDVLANPHARLLLIIFGLETLGAATVGILTSYMAQYVLDMTAAMVLLLIAYSLPQFLLAPLWVALAGRFGKRNVWLAATLCAAVTYVSYFWVSGGGLAVWVVTTLLGVWVGCGAVMAPSMQADVIDYDEMATGTRKEGAYYATWNLVRKGASSLTAFVVGVALQWVGFEPNQVQSETVQTAIRGLFAFLPGCCFVIGALCLWRYDLHQAKVEEIQRRIVRAG